MPYNSIVYRGRYPCKRNPGKIQELVQVAILACSGLVRGRKPDPGFRGVALRQLVARRGFGLLQDDPPELLDRLHRRGRRLLEKVDAIAGLLQLLLGLLPVAHRDRAGVRQFELRLLGGCPLAFDLLPQF